MSRNSTICIDMSHMFYFSNVCILADNLLSYHLLLMYKIQICLSAHDEYFQEINLSMSIFTAYKSNFNLKTRIEIIHLYVFQRIIRASNAQGTVEMGRMAAFA